MFDGHLGSFSAEAPADLAKLVAEAMLDGMWELDFTERMFHYSRNFCPIFGNCGERTKPGLSLEHWLDTIHPDDRKVVFSQWNGLLAKDHPYRIQYRVVDQQNRWRWIASTICAVLRSPDGAPLKATGFHFDITEAVHTEQVLAVAQERLRLIFDHAGMGIATSMVDGTVGEANPALGIILGRRPSVIVGKTLSEFIHEEDKKFLEASLDRLVNGGRSEVVAELRFVRPDGSAPWTRLTGTISATDMDGGRFVVALIEDITESRHRQTKLVHDATHDNLTGAWTRGVLLDRLGQHISLALRHRQPMSFCICDLDHFKQVNDTYGHQAGDKVLAEFVRILNECVRDTDVVGRYGGEEFGVVFPNTDTRGAAEAMERARERMRRIQFHDDKGRPFSITASFGICGVDMVSNTNSMVAMADSALYCAKKSGRDRVNVAGDNTEHSA